jgi:hypothetical protein
MIGTMFVASAICVRLWYITASIRKAITDPHTMALIITEDSVKSDNASSEAMLNGARSGIDETEASLMLFAVCLAMIGAALVARIFRRKSLFVSDF